MVNGSDPQLLKRILVVEDDPSMARLLDAFLQTNGYRPLSATDGPEALEMVEQERLSLIILDLNLPKLSGFEVCQRVREVSQVPIIVVSGRATTVDKTLALGIGADDYVTKPFNLQELLARVRALIRRSEQAPEAQGVLQFGSLSIDLGARQVARLGQVIQTTPIEFDLLRLLASNSSRVVTHQELLVRVWGEEYVDDRECLRVHMSHIRRKIEPDPKNPRHIKTVPGVGYRFSACSQE
ncbi:MAG: response regulator transcription factor [Chloroflexi bacterium]|nr:response regulator transcription factor [Chloroflexota bacterium]